MSKPPGFAGPAGGGGGATPRLGGPGSGGSKPPGYAGSARYSPGQLAALKRSGQANAQKQANARISGGGGILGQVGDIMQSMPSGIVHMGIDAAKEAGGMVGDAVTQPVRAGYRLAHGDVEGAGRAAAFTIPGVKLAAGLAEGATGKDIVPEVNPQTAPLTRGFGESFRRTYEDALHPTHFVKAYNEGHIVGKVLEDAANASIVGGLAAKALDVGAKGAFSEAASAQTERAAAERAASSMEKGATAAEQAAAGHEAAVETLKTQIASAPRMQQPQLRAELGRAEQVASSSRAAADESSAALAAKQAEAQAAGERAAGLSAGLGKTYQAYRVANATAKLTGQGANLPMKPLELAMKGLSEGAQKFLGSGVVRDALQRYDDAVGAYEAIDKGTVGERLARGAGRAVRGVIGAGEKMAARSQFAGENAAIDAEAQRRAQLHGAAVDAIKRVTGDDPVMFQASQLVATGAAQAMDQSARVIAAEATTREAAAARLSSVIDEVAASFGMDPRAIHTGLAYVRGELPNEQVATIDRANAIYDRQIAPALEADITTETKGMRRAPTPEQAQVADWNVKGQELYPPAVTKIERKAGKSLTSLGRAAEKQGRRVLKRAEAAGVTPGATGTAAETQALQAALAGNNGRGALGALKDYRAAAEAAGRAGVAETAAARFKALRDTIPAKVPDEVVGQLSEATRRFEDATTKLRDAAVAPEPGAGELVGKSEVQQRAAVVAEIRNVRKAATDLADQELTMLADSTPTSIPFVPGDLSELHHELQGKLGVGDISIDSAMERVARKLGARRWAGMDNESRFVAAYNDLYDRLPREATGVLHRLEGNDLRALYDAKVRGTLSEYAGGLDTLAAEFTDGDVHALLDSVARKGNVQEFLFKAKAHQWDASMVDRLANVVHGDSAALTRDPAMRIALGETAGARRASLPQIADEVMAHRADQGLTATGGAAAGALELPAPDALAQAASDHWEHLDTPDGALAAIDQAYHHDPAKMDAFHERWQAAGEPDLAQTVDDLMNGREPAWLHPPEAAMGDSLSALRAQEQARADITGTVGEAGGQAARSAAAQEAGRFGAQAARNQTLAESLPAAQERLVDKMSTVGATKGLKAGRKYERYTAALKELGLTLDKIDRMPEVVADQIEKLHRDIVNAPSRARPAIAMAREMTGQLQQWLDDIAAAKVDGAAAPGTTLDPAMEGVLHDAIALSVKDIRDVWTKVDTREGLVPGPPTIETKFRAGGQPLERGKRASMSPTARAETRSARAPEEKMKVAQHLPRNTTELRMVLNDRIRSHVRNEAARLVADKYGTHVEAELGPGALADLHPGEIIDEMRKRGYVAWDPESFGNTVPRDAATRPGTLWVPETIAKASSKYWGAAGTFEKFMRRYYDKPLTWWKAAVLALRPAWHVNNMLSNATMAMVGGGLRPDELFVRMRQARALLKLPEALDAQALPETAQRFGPFAERRAARLGTDARVAKLERRVGTIEAPTRRALGETATTHAEAPTRLIAGPEGSSLSTADELGLLARDPGLLRRTINSSYALNGAVDDMSRVAVLLDKMHKLTEPELNNLIAKHPELGKLTPDQLRVEGAMRESLAVAGDFMKMTPLERQVFRRVMPFYVWIRHITKLAVRMPVYNPLRTVWVLHLADLWGTPGDFGLASGYPLNGSSVVQMPMVTPFGDSIQGGDPTQLGFNLSPAIKIPVGALTGLDLNRMAQFQRPPGQPGGYGGDPAGSPLISLGLGNHPAGLHLGELGNLVAGSIPQTRPLRSVVDTLKYGKPVMRYPLGQIRRTAKNQGRQPIGTGEPIYGQAARLLGLPFKRGLSPYEAPQVKTMLKDLKKAGVK